MLYQCAADYHFIQCFVTLLQVASSATRMPRVPTSPLATVTRWKTRAVTRARITSLTLPLVCEYGFVSNIVFPINVYL